MFWFRRKEIWFPCKLTRSCGIGLAGWVGHRIRRLRGHRSISSVHFACESWMNRFTLAVVRMWITVMNVKVCWTNEFVFLKFFSCVGIRGFLLRNETTSKASACRSCRRAVRVDELQSNKTLAAEISEFFVTGFSKRSRQEWRIKESDLRFTWAIYFPILAYFLCMH